MGDPGYSFFEVKQNHQPIGVLVANKSKRGRPPKQGERFPSGKLKPAKSTIEPIAPALWARLKTEAVRLVGDTRFGSEIGRLSMHGELTAEQASAGFRFAQIYGRFERYKQCRRSAASPSYMAASGTEEDKGATITPETLVSLGDEELLDDEALAELMGRITSADLAFRKVQKFMSSYPGNVRAALELLCVDDAVTNPVMLENIRNALDDLAVNLFRIKAAPKEEQKQKRRDVIVTRDGGGEVTGELVLPDPDKVAWRAVLRRLRPDMTDAQVDQAYALTVAIKAREVFQRQQTRRNVRGAIIHKPVYLHPRKRISVVKQLAPKVAAIGWIGA